VLVRDGRDRPGLEQRRPDARLRDLDPRDVLVVLLRAREPIVLPSLANGALATNP
jgi:hypothetical protein